MVKGTRGEYRRRDQTPTPLRISHQRGPDSPIKTFRSPWCLGSGFMSVRFMPAFLLSWLFLLSLLCFRFMVPFLSICSHFPCRFRNAHIFRVVVMFYCSICFTSDFPCLFMCECLCFFPTVALEMYRCVCFHFNSLLFFFSFSRQQWLIIFLHTLIQIYTNTKWLKTVWLSDLTNRLLGCIVVDG